MRPKTAWARSLNEIGLGLNRFTRLGYGYAFCRKKWRGICRMHRR